jgi:hypothetical protein
MFYTWACPRRPIGTSLGLDWDENSYLGGDFHKKIATMIPFSLKFSYSRGQYIATVGCYCIKGPAITERIECDGKMVLVQEYFETKLKI